MNIGALTPAFDKVDSLASEHGGRRVEVVADALRAAVVLVNSVASALFNTLRALVEGVLLTDESLRNRAVQSYKDTFNAVRDIFVNLLGLVTVDFRDSVDKNVFRFSAVAA